MSVFRLHWHEIAEGQCWQAGGLSRLFEITVDDGKFVVDVTEGERFPENIGEYATLDAAQRAAQRVFAARGSTPDPLGARLAQLHPERRAVRA